MRLNKRVPAVEKATCKKTLSFIWKFLWSTVLISNVNMASAANEGAPRASPCRVFSLTLSASGLPPGVKVFSIANEPSIDKPARSLSLLTNPGAEPFYLVTKARALTEQERLNSGVPADYYSFYKFQDGKVFEWKQDQQRSDRRPPELGYQVFGWTWREIDEDNENVRSVKGIRGLELIPNRFDYLRSDVSTADLTDCRQKGITTHRLRLYGYSAGRSYEVDGNLRLEPIAK